MYLYCDLSALQSYSVEFCKDHVIPPCPDVCSTKKYLFQPAELFEAIFNLQGVGIVIDQVPNPLATESEAGNLTVCLVMTVVMEMLVMMVMMCW